MAFLSAGPGCVRRAALPLVLAAVAALFATPAARAATPYLVAEVDSGRVLMAEDATMPWQPASLAKLMTAYVALKRIKTGAISLETAIAVSARAAAAAPSKIGAKPGTEVTLDNALKLMLVKSANDMAVVVAEGVGGTVENFAAMMNREAAAIGMAESRFVNPNGLYADGQQTSARDMALLARAILLEFPERARLFSIGSVQLGAKVMENTNGLIGRYPGIEGMKTGFICASGFNLVAVASRNGRRLVAVVFGQPGAADRTIKAASLLDRGFSQTGFFVSGTLLGALPPSGVAAPPDLREDVCVRRKGLPASEDELETVAGATATTDESGINLIFAKSTPSGLSSVRGANGPRSLAPRALGDPVPVFLGRAPGSDAAPPAANSPGASTIAAAYASATTGPSAPLVGTGAGPLMLKPVQAVPLRIETPPSVKAMPSKTVKAAAGSGRALPTKAARHAPKKHAGKPPARP